MIRRPIFLSLLLALGGLAHAKTPDQLRTDFIDRMVREYGFEKTEVTRIMHQARLSKSVLEAISRPAERVLNWTAYRKIFVTPTRIAGGVAFWREHAATLARAEREYGVPPHIIVAILGVETRYGAHTGGYRVLDALHTLGFHYPRRGKFFREQLSHFLRFAREENINPADPTGSYAGAMGVPQFMPDSFRDYAVDFDGDGRRDIWDNHADVIGSVANYFVDKGNWRSGAAVAGPAHGVTSAHRGLIEAGAKPSLALQQLIENGISFDASPEPGRKVSLLEFNTDAGKEYWVGMDNFYAIMRYNPRTKYALAVYQLAEAIRERHLQSVQVSNTDGG